MDGDNGVDAALVEAAREGDPAALDRLAAAYLPLVYNVVGRALAGDADIDDLVQETMLRAIRGLGDLRSPASFRSWLLAIALHQVRNKYRTRHAAPAVLPYDLADPGADFADLTILRLHLSAQRREVVEAVRWLDADNRELLALWWLEAAGELTREELVAVLGLERQHAAVRIQRMRAQLDSARAVVRALDAAPRCAELMAMTDGWPGRPEPVWRKRIARHTRDCERCRAGWTDVVDPERLLVSIGFLAAPPVLAGSVSRALRPTPVYVAPPYPVAFDDRLSAGPGRRRARGRFATIPRPLAAAVATVLVILAASVGYALLPGGDGRAQDAGAATDLVATATPGVSATPSQAPTATPSRTAKPSPTATPKRVPPPPAPRVSPKKGVSTWDFSRIRSGLSAVDASWYYNWSPTNATMPAPTGVEFVPMIWGANAAANDDTIATVKRAGGTLLTFNEPDLTEQANMSVDRALDLWPKLQSTGMRLSSPAPAGGGADPEGWLDRFMAGARERGYRVDFIALHWYGSDFSAAAVGQLKGYLEAVHKRYGLPIWLTEFALINFGGGQKYPSDAQQAAFIAGATRMLQSLSYVQRYAWFGLPATNDSGTGLYTESGDLTAAGRAYRAAG